MTTHNLLNLFERFTIADSFLCRWAGGEKLPHCYALDDINCDWATLDASDIAEDELKELVIVLKRRIEFLDLPLTIERSIGGTWYCKLCNPKTTPVRMFQAKGSAEAIVLMDCFVQLMESIAVAESAA